MYVIAGVSGHVGSVVASELLAKGKAIKVIVRDSEKGKAWSSKGAEVAVGSLADSGFLAQALKGATGFFTLLPPDFGAAHIFEYQKRTSDAIAGAVKHTKVSHVVMLSSVGAELESGTGPIRGLNYLEKVLGETGTQLTAIRAGYFQENVGNMLAPAKAQGIFPNFTPSQDYPMPMIATQDIGVLAAECLLAPQAETIDLVGPAYSIRQLAEKLGSALGKPLQIVDVPPEQHVGAMLQAGMPAPWAESFAEMYAAFGAGKVTPKGDRLVQGTTTLDEVIKTLVG